MNINGTPGDDYIVGTPQPDEIRLGDGNDQAFGHDGDDRLLGEAGNDYLSGDAGNDVLNGGAGDDRLDGAAGDDTYLFGRGSGRDDIDEHDTSATSTDTVLFLDGVTPADVVVNSDLDNLQLRIIGTTDRLRIEHQF